MLMASYKLLPNTLKNKLLVLSLNMEVINSLQSLYASMNQLKEGVGIKKLLVELI
jgi:hypothetical protein